MFRAIKRVFIWLGLIAERATETDAINEAVVERGIRDSKAKADKAHYANGQLAGQIALLKDQIKRQERQREKAARRAQKRQDHATRPDDRPGEDPDIAGIVPGPQPVEES